MESVFSNKATAPARRIALALSLAVTAAIVLVGCSSPASSGSSSAPSSGTGSTVTVTLTEWTLVLDKTSVPAGTVTFSVTNAGTQFQHEMVVLKTDLDPASLPVDSTGKVDEATSVGEVSELDMGATGSVTLDLTAGKYVLICNIVEAAGGHESHYNEGMRVAFTVT